MKNLELISILKTDIFRYIGFAVIFLVFLFPNNVFAGASDNVSGYAWSEIIGWINFNCTNLDTCGTADYGVNIETDGNMTGYAWSENIGWIDFNPLGPYPISPDYSAKVNLDTGEVSGWARVLASGDGWDGWIKLRNGDYGVTINQNNGEFSGYAWSDQVIGWISFNCDNEDVCETSDYKVITDPDIFNQPPDSPGIDPNYPDGESWNNCSIQELSIPTFHWTYYDADEDPQDAYEIWVDNDSSFPIPKFNHLVESSSCTSYTLNLNQDDEGDWLSQLAWGTTYYWKVKVKDDQGNWSEFSDPNSFTTSAHAYPWIDFSWSPDVPSVDEIVQFTDESEVFGGSTKSNWSWIFQDGDPNTSTDQNPEALFVSTGEKEITLSITDSDGLICTKSKTLAEIELPLPDWKEIPPFIRSIFNRFLAAIVNLLTSN